MVRIFLTAVVMISTLLLLQTLESEEQDGPILISNRETSLKYNCNSSRNNYNNINRFINNYKTEILKTLSTNRSHDNGEISLYQNKQTERFKRHRKTKHFAVNRVIGRSPLVSDTNEALTTALRRPTRSRTRPLEVKRGPLTDAKVGVDDAHEVTDATSGVMEVISDATNRSTKYIEPDVRLSTTPSASVGVQVAERFQNYSVTGTESTSTETLRSLPVTLATHSVTTPKEWEDNFISSWEAQLILALAVLSIALILLLTLLTRTRPGNSLRQSCLSIIYTCIDDQDDDDDIEIGPRIGYIDGSPGMRRFVVELENLQQEDLEDEVLGTTLQRAMSSENIDGEPEELNGGGCGDQLSDSTTEGVKLVGEKEILDVNVLKEKLNLFLKKDSLDGEARDGKGGGEKFDATNLADGALHEEQSPCSACKEDDKEEEEVVDPKERDLREKQNSTEAEEESSTIQFSRATSSNSLYNKVRRSGKASSYTKRNSRALSLIKEIHDGSPH